MSTTEHGHLPWSRVSNRVSAACLAAAAAYVSSIPFAHAQTRESRNIEEVIVTAQKRSERIEDVPISISVLGGSELDSSTVEGITEAINRVPGVVATPSVMGGGTHILVRGVGANAALFTGSSPIAYYLDSVPFGLVKTAIAPDSNAYDLDRIEVLRGPQSTLYGASAQNGVVRVLTKDADLNRWELKTRTSVSTTEDAAENYRGDIVVNAPLVEGKFAARMVVGYEDLSGWIERPFKHNANDAQLHNYRLKLNFQPTEALSITSLAWLSRADYGAPSVSDDDGSNSAELDESISTDYDVYGLKFEYELPRVAFSSTTSYLTFSNSGQLDLLPFVGVRNAPLFTQVDSEVFSHEMLLSSIGTGAWRWSIGGIYRDGEDRLLQTLVFNPANNDFYDISRSFALFGELTRTFADGRLELTGGLRHFEDDVTTGENVRVTGAPNEPLYRASRSFDADSPRVILTWHPSERSTVYVSYAEGFRSGFDQNSNVIAVAPQFPPLLADNLKNYEVGVKGTVLESRLSYEAAVYYMDWQDVQQSLAVAFGTQSVVALVNGQSASGVGVDFAVTARPVAGLDVGVNFSWNDLAADSQILATGIVLFDQGSRLNYSPEYTAGAFANYAFPIGAFEARFSLSGNYTSESLYRTLIGTSVVEDVGEAQLIARTSVALESPGRRWTTTFFVDNLNNEDAAGTRLLAVNDWAQRVRPRTVGLQFEYRF